MHFSEESSMICHMWHKDLHTVLYNPERDAILESPDLAHSEDGRVVCIHLDDEEFGRTLLSDNIDKSKLFLTQTSTVEEFIEEYTALQAQYPGKLIPVFLDLHLEWGRDTGFSALQKVLPTESTLPVVVFSWLHAENLQASILQWVQMAMWAVQIVQKSGGDQRESVNRALFQAIKNAQTNNVQNFPALVADMAISSEERYTPPEVDIQKMKELCNEWHKITLEIKFYWKYILRILQSEFPDTPVPQRSTESMGKDINFYRKVHKEWRAVALYDDAFLEQLASRKWDGLFDYLVWYDLIFAYPIPFIHPDDFLVKSENFINRTKDPDYRQSLRAIRSDRIDLGHCYHAKDASLFAIIEMLKPDDFSQAQEMKERFSALFHEYILPRRKRLENLTSIISGYKYNEQTLLHRSQLIDQLSTLWIETTWLVFWTEQDFQYLPFAANAIVDVWSQITMNRDKHNIWISPSLEYPISSDKVSSIKGSVYYWFPWVNQVGHLNSAYDYVLITFESDKIFDETALHTQNQNAYFQPRVTREMIEADMNPFHTFGIVEIEKVLWVDGCALLLEKLRQSQYYSHCLAMEPSYRWDAWNGFMAIRKAIRQNPGTLFRVCNRDGKGIMELYLPIRPKTQKITL